MVTSATSNNSPVPATFPLNVATGGNSTTSFAQELAGTLEQYLGSNSNLSVDIQAMGGQSSGSRQFLVTVNPTRTSSTAPAGSPSDSEPTATTADAAALSPTAGAPSNEVDSYWAQQPPEVQALRDVADDGERAALAQQLANDGYKIDVPIMVWRWDPLITMTIRQNTGYTWVPSGNQQPLPTCPNCSVPGLPSYDPANPPAGSIPVSTDFAKGLESTAPWTIS